MIEDTLLVSCPGEDGGLFVANGRAGARVSSRPITGVHVGNGQLIYAYQENGGKSVRVFADGRTEERKLSNEPMDLHDLLNVDGYTYAAVTESNSVVCFDGDLERTAVWELPGENDSAHLNSVTLYQGHLLASVFGRFQRHREYKDGTRGRGEVVDIKTGQTFISGLSQPHSLTVVDDLLYLCSSEDREVRVYRGQELLHKIPVPGYARGLAVTTENVYVGLSLSRNAPITEQRASGATIAVIDKNTLQLTESLQLSAHEIYDVRIISRASWVLPHILAESVDDQVQSLMEALALYKRGYEAYKSTHDDLGQITGSLSWKIIRPFFKLEQRIRGNAQFNRN